MILIELQRRGSPKDRVGLEAEVRYRAEVERGVVPAALDEMGGIRGEDLNDDELAPSEIMTPADQTKQPTGSPQFVFDLGAIQLRRSVQPVTEPGSASTIRYGHEGTSSNWGEQ
jgi:hypothetical protein